jgi:hypothetical protein
MPWNGLDGDYHRAVVVGDYHNIMVATNRLGHHVVGDYHRNSVADTLGCHANGRVVGSYRITVVTML